MRPVAVLLFTLGCAFTFAGFVLHLLDIAAEARAVMVGVGLACLILAFALPDRRQGPRT